MTSRERARIKIKDWRENPKAFVFDNFQTVPDKWQEKVLDAFPDPDPLKARIAMQACVGPGKSAIMSWCGWNFLSCYGEPGDHPKGAAVSITGDNLADNLWPEYSKWQSRSPYLMAAFQWTKSRIFAKDHPETWFMAARSFSKTANTEEQGRTLSGLHSKYVLAQIDEGGDIPPAVAKAAEQALATKPKFGKILLAGNPTSHEGILYAAATTLRDIWYVVRITGDPDDPERSPRIDIDWARQQITKFGRDNPWVMSSILGQFPPGSINTLLSPDEVDQAMSRQLVEGDYDFAQKRLGIDVARFGDDRTIIFPRQGLRAFKWVELRNARTEDIAGRAMFAKSKWGSEMEFVDGTGGYGAGVIDSMLLAGAAVQEVQAAGKPMDMRYANKRAEMWFRMAEFVRKRGSLPRDSSLAKELVAPTYHFHGGRFLLEPKDQIKKRLGFSPDIADALSLTFALPDMPAANSLQGKLGAKLLSDYDPFAEKRD